MEDASDIKGDVNQTTIPFDYLVVGVGAQNSTFGIPGVESHACFLKEVWDATKIRTRIMVSHLPISLKCSGLYRDRHVCQSDSRRDGAITAYGSCRWWTYRY